METITFDDSGKIFRLGDSLETDGDTATISASGITSNSVITSEEGLNNLRKNYKSLLTDYPTLRIKMYIKNDLKYIGYATDEEIQFDNLIKIVDAPLMDEVPERIPLDTPLWRVHLSQIGDKTKIRVSANHCLVDGMGLFDLFDLFTSVACGKEIKQSLKDGKNLPILYEFGKKEWYTKEITENPVENPYNSCPELKDVKINPKITVPCSNINPQWSVPYPPISKFCRKYNVTPQGVLMAIQNEANRLFNQGKYDEYPIPIYIPVDTRKLPYSTDTLKKSLFFSRVGCIMPLVNKEVDILENMKKCTKILKEYVQKTTACDVSYNSANMKDIETGVLTFPDTYPDTYNITFASHLGLVGNGFEDIQFRYHGDIDENMYWPCFYGYHTKDTFTFMFSIPSTTPDSFLQSIKDTSLKYYDFMVNDVKE